MYDQPTTVSRVCRVTDVLKRPLVARPRPTHLEQLKFCPHRRSAIFTSHLIVEDITPCDRLLAWTSNKARARVYISQVRKSQLEKVTDMMLAMMKLSVMFVVILMLLLPLTSGRPGQIPSLGYRLWQEGSNSGSGQDGTKPDINVQRRQVSCDRDPCEKDEDCNCEDYTCRYEQYCEYNGDIIMESPFLFGK